MSGSRARRCPARRAARTSERNAIALRYVRFLFAGPSTVGLLHADPHPGNFKIMPDGRLGVVDFGLVARMPEGLPSAMGRILRIAQNGRRRTGRRGPAEPRASSPPTSTPRT